MGGSLFRASVAEALGTFIIVFVGGSAICMNQYMAQPGIAPATGPVGIGVLGIALAVGFATMLGVYVAAGISGGHVNPAVTFGLWSIGRIRANQAFAFMGMQLLGAVAGGIAVWAMFSGYRELFPYLGTPQFNDNKDVGPALSLVKAIGIEALLTFVLTTVFLGTAIDAARSARQFFGFCVGMVATCGILIGHTYTGAALNPARYFGPAVVSGKLSPQIAVYFVGPILGAVIAAFLYKLLWETKEQAA
jgi:MIP family channel proteins